MDLSNVPNTSQDYDTIQGSEAISNSVESTESSNWNNVKSIENLGQVKNNSIAQNATNSHPLMYSPTSPANHIPDLIPYEPVLKKLHTRSSSNEVECQSQDDSFEKPIIENYNESLPDFPPSPSAIKKSLILDTNLDALHGYYSDNENDKSVYEAHLSSNFQNVSLTLNEKEGNLNFLAHGRRSNKLRKVKVVHLEMSPDESDVSSLDSFNESLKSEDVFMGSTNFKESQPTPLSPVDSESSVEAIEPLSAEEEKKCARFWQPISLPGGEQRRIDMRVIEPYKRVLSHGGYLRAGGHTALVVFSACFLPDRSRVDYDYVMDNLFLYILWTLDRLVTDDYVLVYLHGGATRLPSFSWLKRCYHLVSRRLRKNLVHLYLVHPTLWIKTMLFMAKPFISSKFFRKITYVSSLKELYNRIALETNAIPDKVKAYDSFRCST